MKFEKLGWIILKDDEMYRLVYSRSEAERDIKNLKWCDLVLGEKHHYRILSERILEKELY